MCISNRWLSVYSPPALTGGAQAAARGPGSRPKAAKGQEPRMTRIHSSTSCALGAFAMDETSRLGPIRVIGVIRGSPAEALIHRPSERGSGFHPLAQHGPAAGCRCHSLHPAHGGGASLPPREGTRPTARAEPSAPRGGWLIPAPTAVFRLNHAKNRALRNGLRADQGPTSPLAPAARHRQASTVA